MHPHDRRNWVQARLDNWARWMADRSTGSVGYPRQSPFMRLGGRAASTDNVIPLDAIEAEHTDRAVESLRFSSAAVWLTLQCRWLGHPQTPAHQRRPMLISEIALQLSCTQRTVHHRIDAGLMLVAQALAQQRERA